MHALVINEIYKIETEAFNQFPVGCLQAFKCF